MYSVLKMIDYHRFVVTPRYLVFAGDDEPTGIGGWNDVVKFKDPSLLESLDRIKQQIREKNDGVKERHFEIALDEKKTITVLVDWFQVIDLDDEEEIFTNFDFD